MDKYLFEEKFRSYLKANDYSQARLARKLHVSRSTVAHWINGTNQPDYETIFQLCELFNLDSKQRDEFITLAGHELIAEQLPANPFSTSKRQSYDAILYREPGNLRKPPHLIGFLDEVSLVHRALDQGEHALITGYGGIGKTALAATVADMRTTDDKGPILWLDANVNSIDTLFEALLAPLNAHHELVNVEGDAKVFTVKQILARESIGSVVLDDLRDSSLYPQVKQAIPDGVGLLITSRLHLAAVDQIVPLVQLPSMDAIKLLAAQAANQAISEDEYKRSTKIDVLCTLLKAHPLSLMIAGAWLKKQEAEIAELVERLENSNLQPLTMEMPAEFKQEGREKVQLVLQQSYRKLGEPSQKVFRHFGLLTEPHATADFLETYVGMDKWQVRDCLKELLSWNFILQEGNDFYAMHDLIHTYAEFRTRTSRYRQTGNLVKSVQKYVDEKSPQFQQLHLNLPNILNVAERATDEECLHIIARLALDGYQDSHGHRRLYLELLDRILGFQHAKYQSNAIEEKETEQLHHLFSKRGNAHFDSTEYQQAVDIYQTAFELAYNNERQAMLLALIGKSARFWGDVSLSEQYFQQAYQKARAIDSLYVLSFVLEQQAHASGAHNDHETARKVAIEQVTISEKLVQIEPDKQSFLRLFCALINWGTAEFRLKQMPLFDILEIYERAEIALPEIDNVEMSAHAALMVAELYHEIGNRSAASLKLHEAFDIYKEQGKHRSIKLVNDFMKKNGYENHE